MMGFELVAAFDASYQGRHFGQGQLGIFGEKAFLFHDVETELNVFGAVAGKWVETDSDPFNPFRLLRSGLFLDSVDKIANEVNFVHISLWFRWL